MTFVQPLDLERILINNLAGSVEIFVFIAFVAIGAMTAMMKIPRGVTIALLGLFTLLIADLFPALYLLTVLLAGLVASNLAGRLITR